MKSHYRRYYKRGLQEINGKVTVFTFRRASILALIIISLGALQSLVVHPTLTAATLFQSSGSIGKNQLSSLANPVYVRENQSKTSLTSSLHVEGNQIKTEEGKLVLLRGWNKGSAGDTNGLIWGKWDMYQQSEVDLILDKMASYGANVVRQLISVYPWIHNTDVITESGTLTYRQCIDDLLTRAASRGIYVIICPFGIYPKDCPVHGWGGCEFNDHGPFDPYTTDGHEGVLPNAAAFANFVGSIAEEHGANTNLIIEPWNEPFWGYSSDSVVALWQSTWQSCINNIRDAESSNNYVSHLVIIQHEASLGMYDLDKSWMNFNWYWKYPLNDTAGNLVYSCHIYTQSGKLGTPKPTSYNDLLTVYRNAKLYDISAVVPVIIGEIGASLAEDPSGESSFLENSLRIFNDLEIGFIGWAWWDSGTEYDMIQTNSELSTGGTVNTNGQLLVDAMNK